MTTSIGSAANPSSVSQGAALGGQISIRNIFGGATGNQQIVQVANDVQVFPFTLPFRLVVNRIGFEVKTGVASQTADIGIYDALGNKLCSSGPLSAATSSTVVQGAPIQGAVDLPAGVYYFAQTATATTVSFEVCTSDINGNMWSIGQALRGGRANNTASAGSLPASLGGLAAFNAAQQWWPVAAFFAN